MLLRGSCFWLTRWRKALRSDQSMIISMAAKLPGRAQALQLALSGRLPRTDSLRHLRVREDHTRVALQGRNVTLREVSGALRRNQQENGLSHQSIDAVIGQLLFVVESFIDRHNQLRNRPQPREVRIIGKKLEKMVRRLNRAHVIFVYYFFGVEQRFVEFQQCAM